jgi:archaellum biogenesis protein FlaJ (TadC family)
MPQFVTNALAFVAAILPALLAFGGVTTAVNQFVQRFVAPKFPKFGSVINTICVDYVEFVAQIANLENVTHSSPTKLEARRVAREVAKGGGQ